MLDFQTLDPITFTPIFENPFKFTADIKARFKKQKGITPHDPLLFDYFDILFLIYFCRGCFVSQITQFSLKKMVLAIVLRLVLRLVR